MGSHQKNADATKRAVIALRKALGKTQQTFAVEILKTAITTVARYETSHPPRGEVLLRLSDIAQSHGFSDLASEFRFLYLDEVFANLGFNLISEPFAAEPRGYLVMKLKGQKEIADARRFLLGGLGPIEEGSNEDQIAKALDFGTGKK